jgi:hypothetical protein
MSFSAVTLARSEPAVHQAKPQDSSDFTLIETPHLPVDHGSRTVCLLSSYNAHDKRQQLLA